jgi:hypothetical protein
VKFLAGLFLLAYAPGRAILAVLRLRLPSLEATVLALILGLASTQAVNKLARIAGVEWAFAVWIAASVSLVVVGLIRHRPRPRKLRFRVSPAGVLLGAVCVLILAMLAADSFGNARTRPDGSLVVKMHYYDGFIRQSVIRELVHDVPPEMPFAAGRPLGYHYGMDLFIALFGRYLDLDVWDLVHRYLAPVFWLLLALTAYLLGKDVSRSAAAGILASCLVVFGSGGWTWLANLAFGAPIGGNPFYSLYVFDGLGVNSFIPGLAVLLAGFLALSRFLAERRRGWLVLAGLLLALASEFKAFFAGPVLGVLIVTGILAFLRSKDKGLLEAAGVTSAFLAPLLLVAVLTGGGGSGYAFSLGLTDWPARVFEALRLGPVPGPAAAGFAGGILLLLAGAFGPSVIALPDVVRRFFARGEKADVSFFLSGLFAACVVYFFVFRISLEGEPRNILNVYVFYLGLVLLQFFFAVRVSRTVASRRPLARTAAYAAAILICIPNTALFLRAKIRAPEPRVFSADFVETARWLERETPAGAVILQPLDVRYLSYFAGRRVVLDDAVHSYLSFHLPEGEIGRRRDAVNRFFYDPVSYPGALSLYRVSYVVVPADRPFPAAQGRPGNLADGGADRFGDYSLREIFRNDGFTVFAVSSLKPGT